jgi:hypothetical protein
MLDRRQMVIDLRQVSRRLTLYDLYLRTIYLKSYEPAKEFIERHFTGIEETIDILIENIEEIEGELASHMVSTMINGEPIDKSGRNIGRVAKEASMRLYRTYLENMYRKESISSCK